jgi:hypothetical protein
MASTRLQTVDDYVQEVRVLLQDKVQPFRYDDADVVAAFNNALLEGRRVRADLFVTRWGSRVPVFDSDDTGEVEIEPQFRLAFVYGTAWQVLTRDEDDVQDARATGFRALFEEILTGNRPQVPAAVGGSVPPKSPQS